LPKSPVILYNIIVHFVQLYLVNNQHQNGDD